MKTYVSSYMCLWRLCRFYLPTYLPMSQKNACMHICVCIFLRLFELHVFMNIHLRINLWNKYCRTDTHAFAHMASTYIDSHRFAITKKRMRLTGPCVAEPRFHRTGSNFEGRADVDRSLETKFSRSQPNKHQHWQPLELALPGAWEMSCARGVQPSKGGGQERSDHSSNASCRVSLSFGFSVTHWNPGFYTNVFSWMVWQNGDSLGFLLLTGQTVGRD